MSSSYFSKIFKQETETTFLNYLISRRMEEAEQDVQRLNEQAARQREADRQVMLDEAKQEIAALVMLATAKVSKQILDSDSDKAMVSAFLDEAGDEE